MPIINYDPSGAQIKIHYIEKMPGVETVKSWGTMKVGHCNSIEARSFGLKTLQVAVLTPDNYYNDNQKGSVWVNKHITPEEGQLDNNLTISIYDSAGIHPNTAAAGSIWCNFVVLGE